MPANILTKLQFQLSFLWGEKPFFFRYLFPLCCSMNIFHVWTHNAACMHFILHCSHGNFQPFLKQMMAGIHSAKSELKLRDPKDLLTAGVVVEYTWQALSYLSRNTVLANNCVRSIQKQQLVLKKRNNSNKIKSPGRKCCRHKVSALQSR